MDGPPRLQLLQVLNEQVGIECVGVIVVYPRPFLIGLADLPLIIAVMADDRDLRAKVLLQVPGQGCFTGAGASGDSDQNRAHNGTSVFPVFLSL